MTMSDTTRFLTSAVVIITVTSFAVVSSSEEPHPARFIEIDEFGSLYPIRDQREVRFVKMPTPRASWRVAEADGKWTVSCESGTLNKPFYLSYQLKAPKESNLSNTAGKSLIFLDVAGEDHRMWELEVEWKRGSDMKCRLKVASGEYQGWYLMAGSRAPRVSITRPSEKTFESSYVTLTRERCPESVLHVWLDGK